MQPYGDYLTVNFICVSSKIYLRKLYTSLSSKISLLNSYTLYGRHLKAVTKVKYLGVTIDCKLSFTKHINIVCKKANSTLAYIRQNFNSCQCQIKADAYLLYVRPILGICNSSSYGNPIMIKCTVYVPCFCMFKK